MLTDISLGQYYPGNSFIHKLDPRTKILSSLAYIIAVFLAAESTSYAAVIGFLFLVIAFSRLPFILVLKSIKPLWIIILLTLWIHVFTGQGEVLWSWKYLIVTKEGLAMGIKMSLRLILLLMISSILTFTTSPIVLTDGIEAILKPFKKIGVPAHELAMMMTIALRFVPTLIEETDKIMKAQQARGSDFSSGSILRRIKSLIPVLVPLFISAFRRADELAMAMEARCYHGGEGRTQMKQLRFVPLDYVAWAGTALLLALLAALWLL